MIKTKWKSEQEIKHSLKNVKTITIFSCATCANICDTGGKQGIQTIKPLLKRSGIKIEKAKTVFAACPVALMDTEVKNNKKSLQKSDALMILSCSSGVKSLTATNPGLKVITPLDTVGITPFGFNSNNPHEENYRINSICTSCDQCVLSFTNGICPVAYCPQKRRYTPCKNMPKENEADVCFHDKDISCVWTKIQKEGEPNMLKELRSMKQNKTSETNSTSTSKLTKHSTTRKGITGFMSKDRIISSIYEFILKIL